MQRPIFLLVSDDGPRLEALRDDLSRRYEADYQVTAAASAAAALTTLAVHAGSGAEVALIIADEHLKDMPAADFLAGAHGPSGSCSSTGASGPRRIPSSSRWR